MPPRPLPAMTLLGLALLLAACGGLALPANSPSAANATVSYGLSMQAGQEDLLTTLGPLPEYQIEVLVDPTALALSGRMTLSLPTQVGQEEMVDYHFRLYPNLDHYGGQMVVDLASINGFGAPFSYAASNTALHLAVPPDSIAAGQPVIITLQWHIDLPDRPDAPYALFGRSGGLISLPLFYPMLAVRDPDKPGGWNLELGLPQGDAAFGETALYRVQVTVPPGMLVMASGSVQWVADSQPILPAEEQSPQVWKQWNLISGPAREFALFLSDQVRLTQARAYGVGINSWHLPGDEAAGQAAADYAAAALRIYSDLFGPYPYAELDVVAGPLNFRGMEYPGLLELGIDLYREQAGELEFRTAHEVAHQWWYNVVGNDPVTEPWLDEGLAEYATYFYRQKTQGEEAAERLAQVRWQVAYNFAVENGLDAVVNQPVDAFGTNYETMVYGKAALFFHALHQEMGEGPFLELLQHYYGRYRFQVATPAGFLELAEEATGPAATEIYQRWILEAENTPDE